MKRLIIILIVSTIILVYGPEANENFIETANIINFPSTRGSIVEALFILQNRINDISELKFNLILALEKAELTIKDLIAQKSESKNITHYEIYKSNIIKGLYHDYINEINSFEQEILKIIEQINQTNGVQTDNLEKLIKKCNLIKDILDERSNLINISFKIGKEENKIDYKRNQILNREDKLKLLKQKSEQNNEKIMPTNVKVIEKLISKLKTDFENLKLAIQTRRENLSKIKNSLAKLEEEYYKLNDSISNPNLPKNWFILRLAKLQNCTKKSNFGDLV